MNVFMFHDLMLLLLVEVFKRPRLMMFKCGLDWARTDAAECKRTTGDGEIWSHWIAWQA